MPAFERMLSKEQSKERRDLLASCNIEKVICGTRNLPYGWLEFDDSPLLKPLKFHSDRVTFQREICNAQTFNFKQRFKYRLPAELWLVIDQYVVNAHLKEIRKVCFVSRRQLLWVVLQSKFKEYYFYHDTFTLLLRESQWQ